MDKTNQVASYLSEYEPSLRERIGNATYDVARYLGLPYANRMRDDLEGAIDFVPGVGDAVGFSDAARDYNAGNYGSAAVGAGTSLIGSIPGGGDLAAVPLKAIFGGVAARTADKKALELAQKMASEGSDKSSIWNSTGWFTGPDDKWRFEIDDSPSSIADPFETDALADRYIGASIDAVGRTGLPTALPVEDVLRHPSLESAYPNLLESGVLFDNPANMGGARGSFSPASGMVTLDSAASITNPSQQRSTMLHELQHAVQMREGFQQGGNVRNSLPLWQSQKDTRISKMGSAINEMMRANPDAASLYRQRNQALIAKDFDALDAIEDQLAALPEGKAILDLDWERSQLNSEDPISAQEAYRRLMGEVEARNVQKRMNMTPEQRVENPPWETEDVPRDLQIFRGGL